jgi:phenylacetate-CoA ligase
MAEDALDDQGRHDPFFQKMVAAFTGDTSTWVGINRRLRDAIVDYAAARSPYYRRVAAGAGGRFERIPILTKAVIRRHLDDLFAEGVPEWRRVPRSTSGSTGEPMVFYRDVSQGPVENVSARRFLLWMQRIATRSRMVWISAGPRLRTSPPSPPGLLSRVRRDDEGFHPVSTVGLTPSALRRQLATWGRYESYWLYGHASAIDWVADRVESNGSHMTRKPVAVVTTGDQLSELADARITRAFDCPVHSWYGSHEFNGYVAGTLPGTRRYAFNPWLVHAEVVDDEGRPVTPGKTGRLVLTDLNNYVFPLIRYDTDDLAVASEVGFVGGFPLVERLEGRSSDVLVFPSGRFVSGVTLGGYIVSMRNFAPLIRFYQCVQTAPNELEVLVVWTRRPSGTERAALADSLRMITDPDTVIRIRDVDELERLPSGKTWIVRRLFEETADRSSS